MIKRLIQQEDITFVNIYAPSMGTPKYIKQILTDLKGEIDSNTIIVGDVNTLLDINGQIIQEENQPGNIGLKEHIRPDGLNRYLQNIPPKSNIIHILLKCT